MILALNYPEMDALIRGGAIWEWPVRSNCQRLFDGRFGAHSLLTWAFTRFKHRRINFGHFWGRRTLVWKGHVYAVFGKTDRLCLWWLWHVSIRFWSLCHLASFQSRTIRLSTYLSIHPFISPSIPLPPFPPPSTYSSRPYARSHLEVYWTRVWRQADK